MKFYKFSSDINHDNNNSNKKKILELPLGMFKSFSVALNSNSYPERKLGLFARLIAL